MSRILYLSINFAYENSNVHTDLIKTLVNYGHEVIVVSCDSFIREDSREVLEQKLIQIKIKTGNQFEPNLLKKGINIISLQNRMITGIKKFLKNEKFDLVLYSTPPITFSKVVKWCKKFYNCKTYLALKDIFPQNAVDLEMFSKKSLVYKYFRSVEKKLYSYSDKIGCMSNGNIEYLLKHNQYLDRRKVELFPNSHIVKDYCISECNHEKVRFIFGGNLGKPQGLKTLVQIIKKLEDYDKAEFLIVGKGSEAKLIKDLSLKNLKYYDYLPKSDYDKYVMQSDIGIISLDARFTIPNIPSKILNYMEISKPILAITDENTDVKEIIQDHNCGWWVSGKNENEIIDLIKKICDSKSTFAEKGANARKCFINEYNTDRNVEIINQFLIKEE